MRKLNNIPQFPESSNSKQKIAYLQLKTYTIIWITFLSSLHKNNRFKSVKIVYFSLNI